MLIRISGYKTIAPTDFEKSVHADEVVGIDYLTRAPWSLLRRQCGHFSAPLSDRSFGFKSTPSDQSHSVPMGLVQLENGGKGERSQTSSHQIPESLGEAPAESAVVPGKLSVRELARAFVQATESFAIHATLNWGILQHSRRGQNDGGRQLRET